MGVPKLREKLHRLRKSMFLVVSRVLNDMLQDERKAQFHELETRSGKVPKN